MKRPHRILAVASAGGHYVQLMRLTQAFAGAELVVVTTRKGYELMPPACRMHVVPDANRWDRVKLARMVLKTVWVTVRERPTVVISTGAAPGYVALRVGRLLGAQTIWVDSIANAEKLSLSGQKAGRYADLWITQWPHLARENGPHYRGDIL